MPRKGENIYKRKDKRWEGRYITSYNAAGRAVYKSVYGKSYTEVKLKMRSHIEPDKITPVGISFAAWTESYLKSQECKLKIGTYRVYERYIKNHIKPFFGNTLLRKMNHDTVQSFVNAHTLRHTFSVRALELGFDIKTLSEILGHADATVTLRIYAHSLDEHKRNSMARFAQIA